MRNKTVTVILMSLLILAITGTFISSASQSTSVITIVKVTGISPPINETGISGYVVNITNSGLPNWSIQLFGVTGKGTTTKIINIQTTTNSNGFYKFNNLSEGRYTLILKLKPDYIPTGRISSHVNLKLNQKSENNNFTVSNMNDFIFSIRKFKHQK